MLTMVLRHVSGMSRARKKKTFNLVMLAALLAALGLTALWASPSTWPRVVIAAHGAVAVEEPGSRASTVHVPGVVSGWTQATPHSQELPHQWMEDAISLGSGVFNFEHGELTAEDGGRDAFSFAATGGEQYIIEVESRLDIHDDGDVHYVEDYLPDPRILEVVNEEGEQVMSEQDNGGYLANSARAFFTPEEDGNYFIAVASGHSDTAGTGHYTITVRQDDHADDWRTNSDVAIRPGESISATIDSDVPPDDPVLNTWNWLHWGSVSEPLWGVESLDDMDVIRIEIGQEGTYRLSVSDDRDALVVWSVWEHDGSRRYFSWTGPVDSVELRLLSGTYYVAVGTTYESDGNTGSYTLSLVAVDDEDTTAASRNWAACGSRSNIAGRGLLQFGAAADGSVRTAALPCA